MKIRKEVKIGFFMLIAISLLVWGINYLKGKDIFTKGRFYYAVYENVDRLTASNPVTINGLKVGQVESVDFLLDGTNNLLVKFIVDENRIRIPEDSEADIASLDFLGSKAIVLKLGSSEIDAQVGDTLASDIEATLTESVNREIAPLKKKAEDLIKSVDSAITVVRTIFNKKAQNDLDASFTSIRSSLESFENTMNRVDNIVEEERLHIQNIFKNIESITKNLAENNEKLSSTLDNINAISDSLAGANLKQTVQNASNAMAEMADMMDKVNRGEGSLGQLINNDTLYENIEAAALDLDKLLLDMRLNPERYVHFSIFGRKDKEDKKNKSGN